MEKSTTPSSTSSDHQNADKNEGTASAEVTNVEEPLEDVQRARTHSTIDESQIDYPRAWKLTVIMIALCLAIFCMALDNTIIATAIPRITSDFNSLGDVGWYGSAYLLTTCAFQLLYGKIYTYFSVKWVFLFALFLFELGSAVCGSAPSSVALIIGRAIAGLGSAGIFSGGILIIALSVPLAKRPIYTGIVGAMYGLASVAGPLLGGVFTDSYLTWRWCFYINLPIGAVTAIFLVVFLKSPKNTTSTKFSWKDLYAKMDGPGLIALLPCIVCLLLALQWGGSTYAWSDYRIIILFVFFGVLAIAFGVIQVWKGDNATVPIRIIKQRSVAAACIFCFSLGASFFLLIYFVPLWFQSTQGDDATQSGIHILPMVLAVTVFSILSGIATSTLGYYTPWLIFGALCMATGSGAMTTWQPNTPSPTWIGLQVLYGTGAGSGIQMPLMAVQTVLPMKDVPTGTAIIIFMQLLGGSVFVSVGQNVFSNQLVKNLHEIVPEFPAQRVVEVGATAVKYVVPQKYLPRVLLAYSKALTETWYVSVAMSSIAMVGALLMEWKSMKAKKEDRITASA